jgi:hypothetical protein
MLKIQEYIKEHGLSKAVADFKLKSKEYDSKVLLKYNQIESDMSCVEVQECRGLILEKDTWDVMSLAFLKFFNSDETNAAKIDWNTAHVLEKLDGTLIQVYHDWNNNYWYAATTGTAEGEGEVNNKEGTTFDSLFWDTVYAKYGLNQCLLNKDLIYIFELTTPYNIVVKPHGESSATLLAVRNRKTLKEVSYGELNMIAVSLGTPLVKRFDLNTPNLSILLKTFEKMVWHEEGYVVVDSEFNRIKIKNPAYVHAHHLKGKMGNHHIMGIIKTNEIEEFIATFKERESELYRLKDNYDKLVLKLKSVWEELDNLKPVNQTKEEQKEYAVNVFRTCEEYGLKQFSNLFFGLANGKITSIDDFIFNYDDKVLYKML